MAASTNRFSGTRGRLCSIELAERRWREICRMGESLLELTRRSKTSALSAEPTGARDERTSVTPALAPVFLMSAVPELFRYELIADDTYPHA